MKNPKVSIVIPVYNGSNYLKQAIDSALAQTYKNIEVIVVNDGSNDNEATEKIAKSYGDKIKYFKKENGGVATALNLGIKKMTGEYFSWLSHDDMYYPEKIELQAGLIKEADDNTIVISNWTIIDKKNKVLSQKILDNRLETLPMCFLAFDTTTWLNACAMLIPVKVIKRCGGFDSELRTTQDYDMHFKLIKSGIKFKILHKPLLYSRMHPEQGCMVDPSALESSDLIHQRIIQDLSTADINKYFNNNYDGILSVYDAFVVNGYKKALVYFASHVVSSLIQSGQSNLAVDFINDKFIGDDATIGKQDANGYISKMQKGKKKRLMFCSGHWLTGGMERVLSILFDQLHDEYEIFLITPFDGRPGCIDLPKYVTHIKVSDKLFNENFDVVELFFAVLLKIDVVTGFMNMFGKQLDFYKLCKGTGIKTIASSHEHYLYPYKSVSFYGIVKKRLDILKDVDAAVWPANWSVAMYSQYNNNGYVMPNPNSFDVQCGPKKACDEKIVISVGRFNDYIKRIDRILSCFSLVIAKVPDAKLMLVGKCDINAPVVPGGRETISDLIKKLNIPKASITFVGEVNNVGDYYARASLILLASSNEGFGMVINEAACFGVPAVCNSIPGIEDLVVDGKNGYITEQDDIIGMANRVCEILINGELRDSLSSSAKKHVKSFDAKTVGDKWKYLIGSILDSKSKDELELRLQKELSFKVDDYSVFLKTVANELNEIFYLATDGSAQHKIIPISVIIKDMPRRLLSSIQHYGIGVTSKKIVKKVYKKTFGS